MIMRSTNPEIEPGHIRLDGISIETTRLSLTALNTRDLDGLSQVLGDKRTARMTHAVPHPLTHEAAESLLDKMIAAKLTHWAIRLDDTHLIGTISLTGDVCGKGHGLHSFGPNLSVFIAPDYWGQGYAVEAIEGLLGWVKRRKLHRVVHAAHFVDNIASASVLAAADFLYTGRRTMETSLAREGEHQALHMIRIL